MSEDFRFFKFKPINKFLIESLVTPSLYFSKPDLLNDPFDCQLDLRKSLCRAVEKSKGIRKTELQTVLDSNSFIENFAQKIKSIGVCSFSLLQGSFDEPLLWSHYADDHKGVCLLYRFTENLLNTPKEIIGVTEVQYEDDVLTNWLINSQIQPSENKFFIELAKVFFTAKNSAWKYEKEVRIIRPTHGGWSIPHGCLEQICFGLRTPLSDIELVSKLAGEYSGCTNFCKVVHADTDFGLSVVEL
ncbi:MAG: hypothetical protein A2061_08700 [Gallionellales bacterium GWA2_59_43]|nr:MAG: hypothetical protein A2061_08700 [Gallionellales bacterium GWA2_59_43]